MKKLVLLLSFWFIIYIGKAQIGYNISAAYVNNLVTNPYLKIRPTSSYGLAGGVFFRTSERMEFSLEFFHSGGSMSLDAYEFQFTNVSPNNIGVKKQAVYSLSTQGVSFNTRFYILPDVVSLSLGLHLISLNENLIEGGFGYYLSKKDSSHLPFTEDLSYLPALEENKLGSDIGVFIQPVKHVQLYVKYLHVFGSIFSMGDEGRRIYRTLDPLYGNGKMGQFQAGVQVKIFRKGKSTRF